MTIQMNKVFFQVEDITPTKAEQYLKTNNNNRPLNEKRKSTLAIAMSKGDWDFNGDAIRFDQNGVLLDGQHRLSAVIASGVTIKTMVVYGLPPKVFDTIDVGATRTAADVLSISGENNAHVLASTARLGFMWEKTGAPSSYYNPTNREIERYIDENPSIREHTNSIVRMGWVKKFLAPSIGAFCMHAFKKSDLSDYADGFFDALNAGHITRTDCPVFLLRETMISDKLSRDKMPKRYKIALVFKAFKKYVAGEPSKTLYIRTSGTNIEKDLYSLPGCKYPLEK